MTWVQFWILLAAIIYLKEKTHKRTVLISAILLFAFVAFIHQQAEPESSRLAYHGTIGSTTITGRID